MPRLAQGLATRILIWLPSTVALFKFRGLTRTAAPAQVVSASVAAVLMWDRTLASKAP